MNSDSEPVLIDRELINDFQGEFDDAYAAIERTLISLEASPGDSPLHHELFRQVHSIKSNFRMLGMDALSDLVHVVENLLDAMRAGQLAFDSRICDVVLLSMDHAKMLFDTMVEGAGIDQQHFEALKAAIDDIDADAGGRIADHKIHRVLQLLEPDGQHGDGSPQATDVEFLRSMALFVESRSVYWQGRSERILALAQNMNQAAGSPVDARQLEVAVYVHDVGMAFIPHEIIHKQGKLSGREQQLMRHHVALGAQLLGHLQHWNDAATMVYQHHEQEDGGGYPQGLTGADIVDGAKIMAIADTFESMTHERPDRMHRRSLLRAVAEINGFSGTQFSPLWVGVFNDVIRGRS